MEDSSGRVVRKVLLVDDDEMILRSWARECHRISRTPLVATTKQDAVEFARYERPELAVVDLRMPVDSGLVVIRELKALGVGIFAVLVSGAMCVDYAMLGVQAGADDCYDKAITITQLVYLAEHGRRPDPEWTKVPSLADVEWQHIVRVLNDCGGNVTHAADALGEHRFTLQRKIEKRRAGALPPARKTRRSRAKLKTRPGEGL
jgi:two-component system, response regulator RegA